MSQKKDKLARKIIKNYLKSKDMQNGQNQPQMSFQQLETFIQLSMFLTGKKPEKLELVEAYYNWFIQEVQRQAEAMGLKPGFKDDKPVFLGVPLEKKVTIVTPEIVLPGDLNSEAPKTN